MDPFDTPLNRQKCQDTYGYLESDSASDKTIIWTLVLIACTILIEVFSNGKLDCGEPGTTTDEETANVTATGTNIVSAQPETRPAPQPEVQIAGENDGVETTTAVEPKKTDSCSFCCSENPSPQTRANRFVVATVLYIIICVAFGKRIDEATTTPYVDLTCSSIIQPTRPNWVAITFLNIIPFVCASCAFLRTLVDSLLVRWGKALTYQTSGDQCFWSPLMPFMVVLCAGYMVFECIKIPIALLMGNREVSLFTAKSTTKRKAEEIEMQEGEAQGLVDDMDGQGDLEDGDGGLPAYDEVCSARRSTEGKPLSDSGV
ncbi:hypothetical protein IQ07DRAFT_648466 [Pyrenochaeta sp. DS3sAY3a]|nr:hypothetical protein IQ07DRAFT_648466 [Pyrenochaeta sp. DS3sAY3a]